MQMIVGVGNPGLAYKNTRHNVGFDVVNTLAETWGIAFKQTRFSGQVAEGIILGQKVILVKPTTYVNKSGECVLQVMNYYAVERHELIVVLDDFDLPVGRIRIRSVGGAGTHNGLRSIVDYLGAGDFARVRIGVGPLPENIDIADFVLSRFKSDEKESIKKAIKRAANAVEVITNDCIEVAQTQFNGQDKE